jgi:ADP-ribosylglycohydrolase
MRSAPVGAYFADDPDRVIYEAKCSAEVTHAHPDGKTGAVAVALAAGWMAQPGQNPTDGSYEMIDFVSKHIPRTETYHELLKVFDVPFDTEPSNAARILGNGSRVIASDTVPFCLWCASRHPKNYTDALWATVSGLGDRDTTCAIVGGIVALSAGRESIPPDWLKAREQINI